MEPWKAASPKEKMPPSDATSQYPPPSEVAAAPTYGRLEVTGGPGTGAGPNA